jgi:predicted nucleotidyltransferase
MGLKNKKVNEEIIKKVAIALDDLNDQVVYVGGAVVSLYADDPAADDVRPTKDIDIFLEITSYAKLAQLQEEIAKKGFFPATDQGIMCRFKYEDILIDIMATKEVGWAPADKWLEPGMKKLEKFQIAEKTINILHISYFLATKFNAFNDRNEDARSSRHFEDIIYVLDNRINLVKEILSSPDDVKNFLIQELKKIVNPEYKEAILAHLFYESQTVRFKLLIEKLNEIINY